MKEGSYFGEISMMTNLRRTSSVYTVSNCFFGVIDKDTFKGIVNANMDIKYSLQNKINSYKDEGYQQNIIMIKNVPQFRLLSSKCIRKIVNKLHPIKYISNQKILQTGEYCDKVYFIKKGKVSVMVKDID